MPFNSETATTEVKEMAAYNPKRESLLLYNNGAGTVFISQDQANIVTEGIPLLAGASLIFRKIDGDPVGQSFFAQTAAGSVELRIYEGVPE